MTNLSVIRHAEAHCNVAGIVGGPRSCTGLTDRGKAQAGLLAEHLHRHIGGRHVTVYSSPRRRVTETAEVTARPLDTPVTVLGDLRDPDYGAATDGQSWQALTDAARRGGRTTNLDQPLMAGGEPWSKYVTRTANLFDNITAQHRDGHILLFGHAETVQPLHQILLGIPAHHRSPVRYAVEHTSLTTWTRHGARWTLLRHNEHCHLQPADVPRRPGRGPAPPHRPWLIHLVERADAPATVSPTRPPPPAPPDMLPPSAGPRPPQSVRSRGRPGRRRSRWRTPCSAGYRRLRGRAWM
jgi:2,3-bisphosphoglycerate-dependent phosphoglycerate mutase